MIDGQTNREDLKIEKASNSVDLFLMLSRKSEREREREREREESEIDR